MHFKVGGNSFQQFEGEYRNVNLCYPNHKIYVQSLLYNLMTLWVTIATTEAIWNTLILALSIYIQKRQSETNFFLSVKCVLKLRVAVRD